MIANRICLVAGLSLCLAACATIYQALQQDRYLDPYATQPHGVVDMQKYYSFRFVDKYRISHRWLSGVNVSNCQYGTTVVAPGTFPEVLGNSPELNMPFVERNGMLQEVSASRGLSFDIPYEHVYGLNRRTGEFEGYRPYCSQAFLSSRNGMALLIIKPDPAKGTDEWVEGARGININGQIWLFKEIPPRDMTGSKRGLADTIEIWTVKIPETAYWLVLRFSADLKYSIQEHHEQHMAMLNLFHQIVASVKLKPL